MTQKRGLILHPGDNVGNALEEVLQGEVIGLSLGKEIVQVEALEAIPFGFKIAVKEITSGEPIIKYGETIGHASKPIKRGSLVHVHNLAGARGRGDLRKRP